MLQILEAMARNKEIKCELTSERNKRKINTTELKTKWKQKRKQALLKI